MNQNYDFLKKARKQPDLQDFCSYLVEPLLKLDNILQKSNENSVILKTKRENLDIYLKIDSILSVHLPEIVDNFCDFSFEFRNTKKIKLDENFFTPKEILLKNTSKIIEEINIIEEQFNSFNVTKTLVTTKVLSNKGMQPQISLTPNKLLEKDSIKLENQFDYSDFKENNNTSIDDLIKKPSLDKSIEVNDELENGETDIPIETNSNEGLDLISTILFLGCIAVALFGFLIFFGVVRDNQKNDIYTINEKEFSTLIQSNNYYTTNFKNWGFAIDKNNGFSYAYKLKLDQESSVDSSSSCYLLNNAFNASLLNKFSVKVNGLDSTFSNACSSSENITFSPISNDQNKLNSETTFLEFNNYLKEISLPKNNTFNSNKYQYNLSQMNSVMTSKDYNTFTYSNWSFSFNKKPGFSYLYKINTTSIESCSILDKKFKMLDKNYTLTGDQNVYNQCLSRDVIILSPKSDYSATFIESFKLNLAK